MKYCLSVGLHNLYFDIAVINNNHELIKKYTCMYDRSKDVSSNIYTAYKKYFSQYKIVGIGVGISNNIDFKDGVIYSIKAFNFDRYNLKQSLMKQFKVEVTIIEETYAASLGVYSSLDTQSLLYVIVDNKISNSFVIGGEIILLEEDINLTHNENLNRLCSKDTLKRIFLKHDLDDEYIGGYYISNDETIKNIVKEWASNLNYYVEKIVKTLKVDTVVFAGYMGEYFNYFKQYMNVTNRIECSSTSDHRLHTLIGIAHLIFKDK